MTQGNGIPMDSRYEHLGLSDWPFQTVPDPRFYRVWADRAEVKATMDSLVRRWERYDRSTLHLMWADFGAGKTHALRHIKARCEEERRPTLCVYAAMPKTMKSFVDLYREVMLGVDFDGLRPDLAKVWQNEGGLTIIGRVSPRLRDFGYALRALVSGDSERSLVAAAWLCADTNVGKRELKPLGISGRIKTTDDAVAAWAAVASTIALSQKYNRIAFLLDEFQQVSACRPQVRDDMNAGLRTLYNTCPTSLTLLLSFSLGNPDNIKYLLAPDLRDRVEAQDNIKLPPLSSEAARVFLSDLLQSFALNAGGTKSGHGLADDGLDELVTLAVRGQTCLPRHIMMLGDAVLRAADQAFLETGKVPKIGRAFVRKVLADVASDEDSSGRSG